MVVVFCSGLSEPYQQMLVLYIFESKRVSKQDFSSQYELRKEITMYWINHTYMEQKQEGQIMLEQRIGVQNYEKFSKPDALTTAPASSHCSEDYDSIIQNIEVKIFCKPPVTSE